MDHPLMKKAAGAPGPRQEILSERADHEHVKQRRHTQPQETVATEVGNSLPIKGWRRKIAGDEKEQSHEEGLQKRLVEREGKHGAEAHLAAIGIVPATERAVGVA